MAKTRSDEISIKRQMYHHSVNAASVSWIYKTNGNGEHRPQQIKLQLAKILIDKVIVDSFFFGKTVDL